MKGRFFRSGWVLIAILIFSGCSMFQTVPQTEITLMVDDTGYAPSVIESTPGTQIKLTLQNIGSQEHQFAISKIALEKRNGSGSAMSGMNMPGMSNTAGDMPQVHLIAAAGASVTLEFIPAANGEYEFTCILPNHTERGTLTVKSS